MLIVGRKGVMKMRGWLKVACALVVVLPFTLILIHSDSHAQTTIQGDGPSMEETRKWLVDFMYRNRNCEGLFREDYRKGECFGEEVQYSNVALDDCLFSCDVARDEYTCNNPGKPDFRSTKSAYRIREDLSKLDPNGITIRPLFPRQSKEGSNPFQLVFENATGGLRLMFMDRDSAERVKRAFARAITLCGGKISIF